MGGKGRKRREKNYLAAHGGQTRLPPPPDPSQLDALPSKLRKIMSFTSHLHDGSSKPSKSSEEKKKQRRDDDEKKFPPEDAITSEPTLDESDDGTPQLTEIDNDNNDEIAHESGDEKRKRKRKRKQVHDLRFEISVDKRAGEKKRERKKKYLEAKKKKKKHEKYKTEESLDFPGREQIQFGDVVQAPPKLVAIPKLMKNVSDASQERVRLQAIEAYRKRRGWTSRPGLQLPNITTTPSL